MSRQSVFLAGPYASIHSIHRTTEANIREAETCAIWLWENNYSVLSPHLNTRDFQLFTSTPDYAYRDFYLSLLANYPFDCFVLLPCWEYSKGTKTELLLAQRKNIPILLWNAPSTLAQFPN